MHEHSRPGPGHPAGAQQMVSGNVAGLHTKELGADDCAQAHAVPDDVRMPAHDVTLSGAACSHSPAHRSATHRPIDDDAPLGTFAAAFAAPQLGSRRTMHPSTSVSVLAQDESPQHVSTSTLQRATMHWPHSESLPASRQCAPYSPGCTRRMHPDRADTASPRMPKRARRPTAIAGAYHRGRDSVGAERPGRSEADSPDDRTYRLRLAGADCGSRIYVGSTRRRRGSFRSRPRGCRRSRSSRT
jgi:hypothetical protein